MAQEKESTNEISDDQVTYLSIGIVLVIAVGSLVIYGIGLAQGQRADSYENKIAGVEEEITQLAEIERVATALGVQEEKLDSLYSSQTKWSGLVADLGRKCVEGVKFSQVAVDREQNQVIFDGSAGSFIRLNQQVVALQESDYFEKVDLTSAMVGDQRKIQFHLTAQLAE